MFPHFRIKLSHRNGSAAQARNTPTVYNCQEVQPRRAQTNALKVRGHAAAFWESGSHRDANIVRKLFIDLSGIRRHRCALFCWGQADRVGSLVGLCKADK